MTKGTKRTVTTNSQGNYSFPDLLPGTYVVNISAPGFKQLKSSPVILTAQQNARFDGALEVGTNTESVEINATPPMLNTENSEIDDLQTRTDLVNMPLNRRSTIEYFYMSSSNYDSGGDISIGGLRGQYTNLTVDGISGNSNLFGGDATPLIEEGFEAISDMKIAESGASAEFPGVASVLVTTRGGENQPHGSLYLTEHNHATDATPYFGGKGVGPERHEFGGSFGGPVVLPKIYNGHDKTFFYFTLEHTTFPAGSGNGNTFDVNVPTAAMQKGDFSQLLSQGIVIWDPTTGKPFPGNVIPTARLSPVSLNLQQFFPQPNFGSADNYIGNYQAYFGQPEHVNREVIRIDHHITNNDILSGRISMFDDDMPKTYGSLPAFYRVQTRTDHQAYLSETHIFSPAVVNEFRLGFARDYSPLHGIHNGLQVAQQAGIEGLITNGADLGGVPTVNFNTFTGFSEAPTYFYLSQGYDLLDNLAWQKGKHSIKAGALIRYAQPATSVWVTDDFGSYTFNGFATASPSGAAKSSPGFDYADFLLGIPSATTRTNRQPNEYNRYTNTGVFVQDTWNVTAKLTITAGLRWEYFMPPVDKSDTRYNFDPANGAIVVPSQEALALVSPLYPSSIPILTSQQAHFPGRSLINGDWKDFGPRLGFAYRLSNRTVIRGGYGLYYAGLVGPVLTNMAGGPFGTTDQYFNSIKNGVPLLQFPDPFAGSPQAAGAQNVFGASTNLVTPRTNQWNLSVERDLGHSIGARLSYRGFMSSQIPYEFNLNLPPASANPNNNNVFRYPNYYAITYLQDGGIQKMESLETVIERKFSGGLTFQAGWTWAKDLSDVGDNGETAEIEDPYNRARDMGNVLYVPRHRFVGNLLWQIPFGKGERFGGSLPKIVNGFVGNWQVTIINLLQSGQFLTATYDGNQPNVRASSGLRADCLANPSISNPSASMWFNAAAFAIPAAGQFGNCARGTIVGPGTINVDFGLHKYFNLTEKAKLQIQARATNVLNHPNFGNPGTDISSGQVGHVQSMQGGAYDSLGAAERQIRLGFRIDF